MTATLHEQLEDLVIGNRILAREGVVDGFGHISMRHPQRAYRFFMSQSRSPELVVLDDIMEFDLDCNPIDQRGRTMYGERPIHGAIYQHRPDIGSVVHNHAHEVIPYSVTKVPMRQIIHTAGGMGRHVPVWDIRDENGELAHTSCVAFGIDRLAVALFAVHGLDLARWPAATRRALAL